MLASTNLLLVDLPGHDRLEHPLAVGTRGCGRHHTRASTELLLQGISIYRQHGDQMTARESIVSVSSV